jgi:hypothetical protein
MNWESESDNLTPFDDFRDARIRLGLWAKENLCSCGAQPDYTREAGLEGLLEFQKRFYDVLFSALKVREGAPKIETPPLALFRGRPRGDRSNVAELSRARQQ